MSSKNSDNMIRVGSFDWPNPIDTEEQDQKILAILAQDAAEHPGDESKKQALENAKRLHDLIPRANSLKWYILMFRGFFTYLTWDENGFKGNTASYVPPTGAASIDTLTELIETAEAKSMPEEVSCTVLHVLFTQLEDFLRGWVSETKEF